MSTEHLHAPHGLSAVLDDGVTHAEAASGAKYRTLFETAGDAIFILELTDDGPVFLDCNSRAIEMFDRPRDQIVGVSPAHPSLSTPAQGGRPSEELATEMVRGALAGTPQRFAWDHYRSDGSVFHTEVTLNRLDLGDGIYIQAITRDVTERRRAEAFERLMMRELNHRVLNNLSSIMSLIPITSASSATQHELMEKLSGRIHAMSVAQEGLAARKWLGVPIGQVIRRILRQYACVERTRLTIDGPDLNLPAGVSGPFSLCVNELATNAVKHGALSTAAGEVHIAWARGGEDTLELRWCESGGPPCMATPAIKPDRGLGLIQGFIEHQLRGRFALDCRPGTLDVSIRIPLVERTYETLASTA